jgi:hypothetical protein
MPSVARLAPVRPQLPTAITRPTQTLDSVGLDFLTTLLRPLGVVLLPAWFIVESQLCSRRDLPGSKEGEVVNVLIRDVLGDREDLAVWLAGVVHESCHSAILLAVDHVDVFLVREVVEGEEVAGFAVSSGLLTTN